MNRIYKVIWNKTRGMYMVVSELAKGQSKDGRRAVGRKKVAQTAAALAVFFSIVSMGGTSFAADTTKVEPAGTGSTTAQEVYTKEGTDKQIDATNKYTYRKAAAEEKARQEADTQLNNRITNVKEYLEGQTVSKTDAAVQDGAVVKAANTIGDNVTKLDAALAKETAARLGADAAQDRVIQKVNDNLVASVNTINKSVETTNKNMAAGFTALSQADATEAAARETADKELNERITNEANAIHETTNQLKTDLTTETSAREAEDTRLNSEIVKTNTALGTVSSNLSALNTAVADGFTALNQADANEAAAREAADTALDARITNVKEYLEKQTSDNYVSKDEAAVQDGAIVKAANTIGENVTNLDAALAKETAARIGADAAQDKVIQQVNDNLVASVTAINQNMADGFNTLSQVDANEAAARAEADAAEASARVAADTKLVEAVNSGLSLSDDNVLQKNTTAIDAQGNVTTSKTDATEMILNKGKDNQITLNENGIKVGTNSSVMDANGVYTGGDTYDAAKAALKSDGSIKGASGAFTVDTSGNVTSTGTVQGATLTDGTATISNGNIKTNGGYIQTGGGNVNTQGGEVRTNGGKVATSGGEINTGSGAIKTVGGDILTAGGKLNTSGGDIVAGTGNISGQNITASGVLSGDSLTVTKGMTGHSLTLTGGDLDAGVGTIKTTGAVETGTLKTTGNAEIGGNLDVKGNLSVEGEFNAKTLSSKLDENNYTTITGGKTQSVNLKMDTATGETKASASTFDETGSNLWAKDDDSIGKSTVTADGISQKLSDTGDNPAAYAESAMSQGTDNKYTMTDTVKDGTKTNVASQSATESSDVVTDADGNTSTFRQRVDAILQEIKNEYGTEYSSVEQKLDSVTSQVTDGTNTTSVVQGTADITNTAEQGTISNIAKDLVNTASENMTNTVGKDLTTTVGGDMTTTVNGKVTEDYKSDLDTKVGGNETHTVEGTLTETVNGKATENYNGGLETTITGEEKHTVNGSQINAITGDQTNTIGGNQTTTVTGDSSLTAENITNEAKNKITNKALDVETDASSSIVSKVSNEYGSNTSTQLSYQTTEEMSQADGKKASYLRGAAEEKSQLTDGAKKTTIDTVAGQTNTNITDGTNTSNSLQKADQVASSVTDGTNTTVVNQDAKSLGSSITDGTKANNTSSTVDKSEQLIKASDTQYSATTKTASKMEDALVSGSSVIDVIKSLDDAGSPTISSAVTDGTNSTGVTQTAKDITNTAKNGTIANDAKNITNTASETLSNSARNITNTAAEKLSNSAAEIENTATKSIKDKVGENVSRTMTTSKIAESVVDGTKSNSSSKTADKDINIVTDGTSTSTLSQLAGSVNTSLKEVDGSGSTVKSLNNVKTVSEDTTKITDTASGAFSSTSQKADSLTSQVKNGSGGSNTVTDTATTSEQKLVSGNIIDILKDAENGYVNTTVSSGTGDDATSTSVKQGTADITNTAKQGTITNEAKNLVNTATETITNTAGTQIQDVVGKSTVTTTDAGTTFENTDHAAAIGEGSITRTTISGNTLETGKAAADYVDVNKDLHVMGNTQLDGTLEVGGKSTFKDDVTMEKNLDVKGTTTTDKLVVNSGASITGGTTTDTLHVTKTSTFDGMVTFKDAVSMEKDLTVGGNAAVTGDVTAKSYKVGDKTYIDGNGINANGQKITNVADGTIAEGSTDAVNGGQLNATNQRVTTVENRMDGVENRMDRVENRVDNLDNRIDKVGANAAAMANLHPMDFDEDSKVSVAAAVGNYRSETAGALGVFYRPTDRVMLNVSTSFGNGENMVGGGVSFKLGKSSKRLAKAEATNAALVKQVTNLQNRLDALLGVLNPSLSKDFPDVPANHWAYEAVSRLAGNDIVQGYEDGKYHGERTMTRYEMAEIIYNALSKGAKAEAKLVEEFRPELQAMAAQRKA